MFSHDLNDMVSARAPLKPTEADSELGEIGVRGIQPGTRPVFLFPQVNELPLKIEALSYSFSKQRELGSPGARFFTDLF